MNLGFKDGDKVILQLQGKVEVTGGNKVFVDCGTFTIKDTKMIKKIPEYPFDKKIDKFGKFNGIYSKQK